MTPKRLARIEARGQAIVARMTALAESIKAAGREPTAEESRRIEAWGREVDSLLLKVK